MLKIQDAEKKKIKEFNKWIKLLANTKKCSEITQLYNVLVLIVCTLIQVTQFHIGNSNWYPTSFNEIIDYTVSATIKLYEITNINLTINNSLITTNTRHSYSYKTLKLKLQFIFSTHMIIKTYSRYKEQVYRNKF